MTHGSIYASNVGNRLKKSEIRWLNTLILSTNRQRNGGMISTWCSWELRAIWSRSSHTECHTQPTGDTLSLVWKLRLTEWLLRPLWNATERNTRTSIGSLAVSQTIEEELIATAVLLILTSSLQGWLQIELLERQSDFLTMPPRKRSDRVLPHVKRAIRWLTIW